MQSAPLIRALVRRLRNACAGLPAVLLRVLLQLWSVFNAASRRWKRCHRPSVANERVRSLDSRCTDAPFRAGTMSLASEVPSGLSNMHLSSSNPSQSAATYAIANQSGDCSSPIHEPGHPAISEKTANYPYATGSDHVPSPHSVREGRSQHAFPRAPLATSPVSYHVEPSADVLAEAGMQPMSTTYVRNRRYPRNVSL
jgi:hypothetical protein